MKLTPALIAVVVTLSSCAPSVNPDITPSLDFDGVWSGPVTAGDKNCFNLEVEGEINAGQVRLKLYDQNHARFGAQVGRIWGTVDRRGLLYGSLGSGGIVNGRTVIAFSDDSAEGFIETYRCKSAIVLSRE